MQRHYLLFFSPLGHKFTCAVKLPFACVHVGHFPKCPIKLCKEPSVWGFSPLGVMFLPITTSVCMCACHTFSMWNRVSREVVQETLYLKFFSPWCHVFAGDLRLPFACVRVGHFPCEAKCPIKLCGDTVCSLSPLGVVSLPAPCGFRLPVCVAGSFQNVPWNIQGNLYLKLFSP